MNNIFFLDCQEPLLDRNYILCSFGFILVSISLKYAILENISTF